VFTSPNTHTHLHFAHREEQYRDTRDRLGSAMWMPRNALLTQGVSSSHDDHEGSSVQRREGVQVVFTDQLVILVLQANQVRACLCVFLCVCIHACVIVWVW
jgi:uncharacterized phage protein gp47/JayE